METAGQPTKLTVVLKDRELYRAIRHAAIERDQPVRDIVTQALKLWLEWQGEQEDLAALAEAEGEATVPWEQVKSEMHRARESGRAGNPIHP